jgi:hypothetical protein
MVKSRRKWQRAGGGGGGEVAESRWGEVTCEEGAEKAQRRWKVDEMESG